MNNDQEMKLEVEDVPAKIFQKEWKPSYPNTKYIQLSQ